MASTKTASVHTDSVSASAITTSAASTVNAAHPSNSGLDILQVVNEGGKVVWNMNSAGVVATNPTNPTSTALLGRYAGASFAAAFPDPTHAQLDFYQITQGSKIVYRVDYLGNAFTS